ncbi:MAG: heme exporter protein CcmB [Betaproteobacteria bacterium]
MSLACSPLASVIARDLLAVVRNKGDAVNTVLFFVIVVSLFPLGIGPEAALLHSVAPGVIWVAALLASLLALSRLFAADHADGTLEQLVLAPSTLGVLVAGKICAHWLATGFPLVVVSPLLGLQFGLGPDAALMLVMTLLLGTPVLSVLGALAAALTLGLRASAVLVPLIVLPLCVPVLIFGAGAVDAAAAGLSATPHLSLLGACLLPALLFGPWAAAAAIKIAFE